MADDEKTLTGAPEAENQGIDNNGSIEQPQQSPPPPDGGCRAWLQCAAGFCVFMNTWGLLTAFGTFQAFYQEEYLTRNSASQISWIGTVQSSFIMLGSVYAGPLYDWGYLRTLIRIGCFLVVFGMFMTSLCTQYWQLLLAQGFLMGIGLGCLFTPTVGILATYFLKKRGLATGISSSGTAIGGIIYPIIFHKLIQKLQFGWTTRVIAFIMLGLSIAPVLGMKQRIKPPAVRQLFDGKAMKELHFSLFAIALFFEYIGVYIPYFYLQIYCQEKQIITGELNFYLLPLLNAAGIFGRVALGKLADKIGPINAFTAASGICAVLIFGWMGIDSEAGVIVFTILYGFFSAAVSFLPATCVAVSLCPDIRQYGVRMVMQLVPSAMGLLIGNPIAGAVLEKGWVPLQGFSAATVLACTLLSAATRVAKVGWGLKGKC